MATVYRNCNNCVQSWIWKSYPPSEATLAPSMHGEACTSTWSAQAQYRSFSWQAQPSSQHRWWRPSTTPSLSPGTCPETHWVWKSPASNAGRDCPRASRHLAAPEVSQREPWLEPSDPPHGPPRRLWAGATPRVHHGTEPTLPPKTESWTWSGCKSPECCPLRSHAEPQPPSAPTKSWEVEWPKAQVLVVVVVVVVVEDVVVVVVAKYVNRRP